MDEIIAFQNKSTLAKTGIKTYDIQVKHFNIWNKRRPINFKTVKQYLDYQYQLAKSGEKSHNTLKLVKSALKRAIIKTFPKEANKVLFLASLDKFFRGLKTPKQDIKIHNEKVLNESEIRKLIDNTPKRVSLIIKMLASTGLRISELCNIKLSDCYTINKQVFIQVLGKNKKSRRIIIKKDFFEEILNVYSPRHNNNDYLFKTITNKKYSRIYLYNIIRKKSEKIIGKSNVGNHTFRHSFATEMLIAKKKSLTSVSQYLGHASTSITADLYIHDELTGEDIFELSYS